MQWKVRFECGFDENDGDYCKESGDIYHPMKGGDWTVDDTSKDDMKLLAMFDRAVYYEFGGEDETVDYGEVDEDTIKENMKNDSFLNKIGVTGEEIDKFLEEFSIYDYFPSQHSSLAEPHDHWFYIKVVPLKTSKQEVDDEFLYRPWKNET